MLIQCIQVGARSINSPHSPPYKVAVKQPTLTHSLTHPFIRFIYSRWILRITQTKRRDLLLLAISH